MAIESQNIYKNARKSAGFTQEKASQLLNVSVDSLRDYEQSQRPVPSDVASAMCDVYQAPYLAVQHLRLTSDLGKRVVPEIQLKDLPEAVLGVLAAVQRFCAKREVMVEIAADGQIAESEQAEWDEIMCLANDLNLERKFGKNSNVVRVRVDGEFPENEDDVFIPMALATRAVNAEPLEHNVPARISIGCDVARFGNDDTAIAQNIDGDIQKLVTRHGQDLYATADDIIAIYKALRAAYPQYRGLIYAVIDDTGVGGGVTDILNREKIRQKLTKLMVVPVNFSSAVPDKEAAGRYADIATWMWAVLRDMATAGTLHIPNDSTLIGQLTTRKYIFAGTPLKLKLEGKDALKKRGLTSPDRADAVALALYEGGIFDVRSLI